ncbi:hypothetical protein CH76_12700 [Lysinibacillus sp. BF-4]|uniref:YdcF family protein n=1 Tax=Lysinibacillus sp. BF-4 TaxID=1473546 RepID=UPI0005052005|nr:YdcF family protein [Lysinibacillus sp. BF-4]KFL42399.1 hypothetical protein CH76_12700 [Lysinibacillus sp. BF-4]
MKKKLLAGLGAMTALHVYFDRLVKGGQHNSAHGEFEYAIVLGAKVNAGGVPSNALKNRLDVALDYATKYPHVTLVVTGGQGADEDATEASVMLAYLTERGLDSSRIIVEDQSTSTYENITNSLKRMPEVTGVTIITSDYHCARAKLIARRLGLAVNALPADTPKSIRFKVIQRERVLLAKTAIIGK